MDDEISDSVQENVETVLLVEDQVEGDVNKVKALEIEVNNEKCVKMKEPEDIVVTLPDGKEVPGQSWRTTPYEVAKGISQGLADNSVVAKVNGEAWDLDRPLEGSCSLALIKFDDEEGQRHFWHSSAHVLGEAMERVYGAHLCYGPPVDGGFYYDMWSDEQKVSI